jgi:hypothetical protein
VEGCIASPLSSDETSSLQQLLSTFLPRAQTHALAAAIARLSELLAEDSQSFDTVGAAQRAVHNVISTLKTAKEGSDAAAGRPATLQVRAASSACMLPPACTPASCLLAFGAGLRAACDLAPFCTLGQQLVTGLGHVCCQIGQLPMAFGRSSWPDHLL